MEWKDEAIILYKAGVKVTDIAEKLGKSRKTISEHINSLPEIIQIRANRKKQSVAKRKEYKKNWKRSSYAEAAMLKRQHEIDVMVLSREQYFNE